jgi:hypothetical protein
VQTSPGCKDRALLLLETVFLLIQTSGGRAARLVVRRATVRSATRPLDIVSFLLTPQETRLRIPATFRFVSGLGAGVKKVAHRSSGRAFYLLTLMQEGQPAGIQGENVQYLPGWTVQCINPECLARGHWLRASDSGGELCSNCNAPLHNVPPPLGPRLRLRPRSLGSYRPPGRSPGRSR